MQAFPQRRADYVFLAYVAIVFLFGLIMLASASAAIGQEHFGNSYFFIKRQLLFGVAPGIVAFFLFVRMPYSLLKKIGIPLFIFANGLLLMVFFPGLGANYGTHAKSWISAFGYSFQPSEFAKVGLIVFFAWYLSSIGDRVLHTRAGFLRALGMAMIPVFLVALQPDIGTVSILFSIIFGMLFLAQTKISHIGGLAFAGVLALALMIIVAPYRATRLTTFLHPELDQSGVGYQINQALLAIGSGGMFGRGYGHSLQKFQYLPEVHGDSIFAVIAEEMGFVVVAAYILLLILLSYRGHMIAKHAPDAFGRLLTGGVLIWLLTQSFLNIGAMAGLLPLTGVPLPFISHGGTSLFAVMAATGMIVNVSKHTDL